MSFVPMTKKVNVTNVTLEMNDRKYTIRPAWNDETVLNIFADDYAANCALGNDKFADLFEALKYVQKIDGDLPPIESEEKELLYITRLRYRGNLSTGKFEEYEKKSIKENREKMLCGVVNAGYCVSFDDDDYVSRSFLDNSVFERCIFRTKIIVGDGRISLVFDPTIYPCCEIQLSNLDHPTDGIDRTDMTLRSFPMNSAGFLKFVKEVEEFSSQLKNKVVADEIVTEEVLSEPTIKTMPTRRQKKGGRGKNVTAEFFK